MKERRNYQLLILALFIENSKVKSISDKLTLLKRKYNAENYLNIPLPNFDKRTIN